MTDLTEKLLRAIQMQLATLTERVVDVQGDQQRMREQVDVAVMSSLRVERLMVELRQDVRTLRERIDSLEIRAPG